jgi:hypothetical protein
MFYEATMLIDFVAASVPTKHLPIHTHGLPAHAGQRDLPDAPDGEVWGGTWDIEYCGAVFGTWVKRYQAVVGHEADEFTALATLPAALYILVDMVILRYNTPILGARWAVQMEYPAWEG